MKIIIDAMGGDHAPDEIVKGAVMAAKEFGIEIILTGNENEIRRVLNENGGVPAGIEIVHTTEVVEMEDDPATVVRTKKDSSMTVALNMLKDGAADAMVSAGSTGALLSGATLIVKRIHGIRRAAMAPLLPTGSGGSVMVVDCGANSECTPEYLLQFAYMGSYYRKNVVGVASPRVGLLNIGTEDTKGTSLQHETFALLKKAGEAGDINFVGNVEARAVMFDACDVVVCDGFSGNVLIKGMEGMSLFILKKLKALLTENLKSKIAAALIMGRIKEMKASVDPSEVGGTALLGISKPVIKAHGSSDAYALRSAVLQAINTVKSGVCEDIQGNIEAMKINEVIVE